MERPPDVTVAAPAQEGRLPMPFQCILRERFWSKVEFTDTCWLWRAGCVGEGYGAFRVGNRVVRAHRWAYEFCVGPIPEGLTLDHLCRVHACVNPDHLEPVTNRVNILRGNSPVARYAKQTHCHLGHPFNTANTYRLPSGGSRRYCRTCKTAWNRARRSAA